MSQNLVDVPSLHQPKRVSVFGFEAADESAHMIEWLRRGRDFRSFVVNDVEAELYAQDKDAQVLSIEAEKPELETKMRPDPSSGMAIVTTFSVIFPLSVHVLGGDGRCWKLGIRHGYHATNMDSPDKFHLQMNFSIIDHQLDS